MDIIVNLHPIAAIAGMFAAAWGLTTICNTFFN